MPAADFGVIRQEFQMKILIILFMFVVAFLFSPIHDTLIGQIGCWIIGGWGVLCTIIIPQRPEAYNQSLENDAESRRI